MDLPSRTHGGQKDRRQGNQPFLIPLADDADHAPGGVDLLGLQADGLTDPQAAGIHHGQANTTHRVIDGGDDCGGTRRRQGPWADACDAGEEILF